jgi:hypothetical protein
MLNITRYLLKSARPPEGKADYHGQRLHIITSGNRH